MRNLRELDSRRMLEQEAFTLFLHLITGDFLDESYSSENSGWFLTHFPTINTEHPTHFMLHHGWEHAFVDLHDLERTATWHEMNLLKRFYWNDSEAVIQIHPRQSEYVNLCKYRLHLWKQHDTDFELPPVEKVLSRFEFATYPEKVIVKPGNMDGWKYVAIICGRTWLPWEKVCEIKQQYFEPEEPAIQIHTGNTSLDENSKHILILWEAKCSLPTRDLV